MATTQRVKIFGVLALIVAVISVSAAAAMGLVAIQVPGEIATALGWAKVALAAVLGGWVLVNRNVEAG